MSLRSINVHLDITRLSDLFFNFEHPEYDRVMQQEPEPTKRRGSAVIELHPSIDHDELAESVLKDAMEFAGILGFDGAEQMDIAAAVATDFLHRR